MHGHWDAISVAIEAHANAPISAMRSVSGRVIQVETATGSSFAVKFGNPSAPLAREVATLRFLANAACPVPFVIATDLTNEDPAWLATEWAGTRTLDAFLGECDGQESVDTGLRLSDAVGQIERAFAQVTQRGVPDAARAMALELFEPWATHAVDGLAWLFSIEVTERWHTVMARVFKTVLGAPLTVGPLDYHASNVVVGDLDPSLTLVDLGAIGYDWPGRRFAQYAISVQSGVPRGEFRTALTPASVTQFARHLVDIHGGDLASRINEVDAHSLMIAAIAATQLRIVEVGEASAERTVGWGAAETRRTSLRRVVLRTLTGDGPANEIRGLLARS